MTESSIFTHIYNELLILLAEKVPDIRYIAQDYGQLEAEIKPTVSFPCVLLDFENTTYSDLSGNVQIGEGVMLLRLATNPYSDDSNLTPEDIRAIALSYYDLEAQLHIALQQWQDDYFGYVTRVSTTTEKRGDDLLRVRQLRYSFTFKDDSAFVTPTIAPIANIKITHSIAAKGIIVSSKEGLPMNNLFGTSAIDMSVESAFETNIVVIDKLRSMKPAFVGFPGGGSTMAWNHYVPDGDGYNIRLQECLNRGTTLEDEVDGVGVPTYGRDFFEDTAKAVAAADIPYMLIGVNTCGILSPFSTAVNPANVINWATIDIGSVIEELEYVVSFLEALGIEVLIWELGLEQVISANEDIFQNPNGVEHGVDVYKKVLTHTNATSSISIIDRLRQLTPNAKLSGDANLYDVNSPIYSDWNPETALLLIDLMRQYFQLKNIDTYAAARNKVAELMDLFDAVTDPEFNGKGCFLSQITMKTDCAIRNTVAHGLTYAEIFISLATLNPAYGNVMFAASQMNLLQLFNENDGYVAKLPFYFMEQISALFEDGATMLTVTFNGDEAEDNLVRLGVKLASGDYVIGVLNPVATPYTQSSLTIDDVTYTDYSVTQLYSPEGNEMSTVVTIVDETELNFREKSFSLIRVEA